MNLPSLVRLLLVSFKLQPNNCNLQLFVSSHLALQDAKGQFGFFSHTGWG